MFIQVLATTAAITVIIALRYLAIAVATHAWLWTGRGRGRRLARRAPDLRLIRREITASLIASPIYALPAAIVIELWKRGETALYTDIAAYPLWWLPLSFVTYIVAQDAYYYWLHRLLHHPRVFPWAHAAHHRSRDPTAFASFAFDPAEAILTAWFLPAMCLVVPIHAGVALAVLTLMTLTAVLNHAGREVWPSRRLESAPMRWLITAGHHDMHHKRFSQNYGLFFRFWDRLAGTDGGLSQPQTVEIPTPSRPSSGRHRRMAASSPDVAGANKN